MKLGRVKSVRGAAGTVAAAAVVVGTAAVAAAAGTAAVAAATVVAAAATAAVADVIATSLRNLTLKSNSGQRIDRWPVFFRAAVTFRSAAWYHQ